MKGAGWAFGPEEPSGLLKSLFVGSIHVYIYLYISEHVPPVYIYKYIYTRVLVLFQEATRLFSSGLWMRLRATWLAQLVRRMVARGHEVGGSSDGEKSRG